MALMATTGAALVAGMVDHLGRWQPARRRALLPGVTSNSITVGTISTQTGTLASNFSSLIYGEKAYYDYINAQGGVNGRKIDYKYALDDGGNPTTFNQLANTLINQDHVFAVTGVATAFFSPNLFVESGIPTYGYNVTGNWAAAAEPLRRRRLGAVLPGRGAAGRLRGARRRRRSPPSPSSPTAIAASADACQAEQNALQAAGYNVSYSDLKVNYPGSTVATDVQRMKQAGSNLVVSCMDVQGNVTMARAIQQYGLQHDAAVVQRERPVDAEPEPEPDAGRLLRHRTRPVHGADQSVYPGLKLYLDRDEEVRAELRRRRDRHPGLGVGGPLRPGRQDGRQQPHAGQRDQGRTTPSPRSRPAASTAPVNWKDAGHTGHAPPYCVAYHQGVGDKYVPTLNTGQNVFNCFESISPKKDPVFPLPAGTPAPA